MWKTVEACHAAQRPEREVVDSILERAANQYRVDGTELNVQVPEMLLRECQKEIEMVRFNLKPMDSFGMWWKSIKLFFFIES